MDVFNPIFHLRACGVLLVALALFHALLSKRFGWREELEKVSLLTRQIFYVHTFFVALTVGLMGALLFFCAGELLRPSLLARAVLSGMTFFWACRLAFQFLVYDRALWRGQKFETRMHILFSILWFYVSAVCGWVLWLQF